VDVSGMSQGKGFAGVIKRHHFSSNRASHRQFSFANKPGSTGDGAGPGQSFPASAWRGHLGAVHHRSGPGGRARRRGGANCS